MANWVEPIFDRTQADVDYAKQQLAQGINNVAYKGCFNVSDANRVEGDTQYLADKLIELYYFNDVVTRTTWSKTSYLYKAHMDRIINNIDALWRAYRTPTGAEALPDTLLTFVQANNIEKNLSLIKELLDNMVSSFRECDDGLECEGE